MLSPLTRSQVRRVDQIAVADFGMSGLVLMENAGRGAAEIIDGQYGPRGTACIVCGTGNNGGDGFVIARHLHNQGWNVRLALAGGDDRLTPHARANANIAARMGILATPADSPSAIRRVVDSMASGEIIVDALLGTGFAATVRQPMATLIDLLNHAPQRGMVAIDIPSGLDCDTGKPRGTAIRADHTITFVAPKVGLMQPGADAFVGTIHVAHIGCPIAAVDAARREA